MPLLTDSLAFLHCPKTCGTWIGSTFREEPHRRLGGSHDPLWATKGLGDRLTFGSVRDPWSWYMSLYLHACHAHREDGVYLARMAGVSAPWERYPTAEGFRAWLRGATHLPGTKPEGIYWDCLAHTVHETGPELYPGAHGEGLASWRVAYTYGDGKSLTVCVDDIVRQHRLYEDLARVSGRDAEYLRETYPAVNTRWVRRKVPGPRDRSEWWTPAMVSWVREADAWLLDLLEGYAPNWLGRVA